VETSTSLAAIAAAQAKVDDTTEITRPADDRLTGAEAIGDFMGTTKRVAIWNMEAGRWPHWREGNRYVASKRALSEFWREATAQRKPGKSPLNPRWKASPHRRGGPVRAA
jgi:hypothetical protein